jgi:ABC-type oligopeptide transport system substrate-binding subunit
MKMKMKKGLVWVLALLLALSIVITGCNSGNTSDENDNGNDKDPIVENDGGNVIAGFGHNVQEHTDRFIAVALFVGFPAVDQGAAAVHDNSHVQLFGAACLGCLTGQRDACQQHQQRHHQGHKTKILHILILSLLKGLENAYT